MIDIEKFICSLLAEHPEGVAVRGDIHRALKEQGLEYKGGKIVPIEDNTELKESERIRKALITAVSGTFKGNTLWHTDVTREEALAWLEKQGEQKQTDKVESFNKYEGLTDFERTLADICIGWIGEEPGWKQYIKDNADVLLKIATKKFNLAQDILKIKNLKKR